VKPGHTCFYPCCCTWAKNPISYGMLQIRCYRLFVVMEHGSSLNPRGWMRSHGEQQPMPESIPSISLWIPLHRYRQDSPCQEVQQAARRDASFQAIVFGNSGRQRRHGKMLIRASTSIDITSSTASLPRLLSYHALDILPKSFSKLPKVDCPHYKGVQFRWMLLLMGRRYGQLMLFSSCTAR
jgi:hypothetical protein